MNDINPLMDSFSYLNETTCCLEGPQSLVTESVLIIDGGIRGVIIRETTMDQDILREMKRRPMKYYTPHRRAREKE
jgi:hypothetical protein